MIDAFADATPSATLRLLMAFAAAARYFFRRHIEGCHAAES